MPHRFQLSIDSQALYITVVTKNRLAVFKTDEMKAVLCRVIDYLKENKYLSSLSKLEHQEQDRNHRYSLWQTEKNVFPIFREVMFMEKVNYIHQNPVRAGLVEAATDYRWSSARIWQGCQSIDEPLLVDRDLIHWRRARQRK